MRQLGIVLELVLPVVLKDRVEGLAIPFHRCCPGGCRGRSLCIDSVRSREDRERKQSNEGKTENAGQVRPRFKKVTSPNGVYRGPRIQQSRPHIGSKARNWWTTGELGQEGVSFIAQVLDADFAGEESVRGHVPQKEKNSIGSRSAGYLFKILAKRDLIEERFLLLGGDPDTPCRCGSSTWSPAISCRHRTSPAGQCFRSSTSR